MTPNPLVKPVLPPDDLIDLISGSLNQATVYLASNAGEPCARQVIHGLMIALRQLLAEVLVMEMGGDGDDE